MIKKILLFILGLSVLAYLGVIKINPDRTKQVLTKAGKTVAREARKVDTDKVKDAAVQTGTIAAEVARETKNEYNRTE